MSRFISNLTLPPLTHSNFSLTHHLSVTISLYHYYINDTRFFSHCHSLPQPPHRILIMLEFSSSPNSGAFQNFVVHEFALREAPLHEIEQLRNEESPASMMVGSLSEAWPGVWPTEKVCCWIYDNCCLCRKLIKLICSEFEPFLPFL